MIPLIACISIFAFITISAFMVKQQKRFQGWWKVIFPIIFGAFVICLGLIIYPYFGQMLFFKAVEKDDYDKVNELISKNPKLISATSFLGETALQLAITKNHRKIVELLIQYGADVNSKGDIRNTPLYLASLCENIIIAKILLRNDADVNAKSQSGIAPLHLAAASGNISIAKLFLENGADVNIRGYREKATPLQVAANHGHLDIVRLLLSYGANINAINRHKETAIDLAKEKNFNEIVKFLQNYKKQH